MFCVQVMAEKEKQTADISLQKITESPSSHKLSQSCLSLTADDKTSFSTMSVFGGLEINKTHVSVTFL